MIKADAYTINRTRDGKWRCELLLQPQSIKRKLFRAIWFSIDAVQCNVHRFVYIFLSFLPLMYWYSTFSVRLFFFRLLNRFFLEIVHSNVIQLNIFSFWGCCCARNVCVKNEKLQISLCVRSFACPDNLRFTINRDCIFLL